ncbi:hypothetical protein V1506DRAFT_555903 [Lipomyces tetrasporus]
MSSALHFYTCITCGQDFGSKSRLDKHNENYHPKAVAIMVGGKKHELRKAAGSGKFICPRCNLELSGVNGLRRHIVICENSRRTKDPRMSERSETANDNHSQTIDASECSILQSFGFQIDSQWRVAVCKPCKYIVDPVDIATHISKIHGMVIPDIGKLDSVVRVARLRSHLAVISPGSQANNECISHDTDDDEIPAFAPDSNAINGLPVYCGFKCLICQDTCTLKRESMRAHISRQHRGVDGRYATAYVQVFYGRSAACQQLRYVQVSDVNNLAEQRCDSQELGIPEDLDNVAGHEAAVAARDKNQFGEKFGAYILIKTLHDGEELDLLLLKPRTMGFQALKKYTIAYLKTCWGYVSAGFQPLLAKIMKKFFRAVQQEQTISNYGEIWAQVLWLGCMAVKESSPSIAKDIISDDVQSTLFTGILARFSAAILCQEFDVVNRVDVGANSVCQFLIPRAINLLSLRSNGTFLQYGQITHNVAAMTYCLRCIFIHNVATSKPRRCAPSIEIVDTEISQFLNPAGSTPYMTWSCSPGI